MASMDPPQPQPQLQTALAAAPASSGQPWLASRVLQRQVVNALTLEPVGRVSDVVFNPQSCQVTALIVRTTAAGSGGGEGLLERARRAVGQRRTVGALGIDHVIALNGDVVMADSDPVAPAVLPAPEPEHAPAREACLLCEVCELTIITLHGMCLGVLADLLLDERGTRVTGYVVTPTRYAESVLMPLEEVVHSVPPPADPEHGASASRAPEAALPSTVSSDPHIRVIPASGRVRIGEFLILVVEEVEPLRQEAVVVSSQPAGEHSVRSSGVHVR